MCAIFGLIDYKGSLEAAQRRQIIKVLGTAAEVRGTDATGIAFFQRDKLCIQKAAKPAHKMRYRIPSAVKIIMGHTRMTTQGHASKNQNSWTTWRNQKAHAAGSGAGTEEKSAQIAEGGHRAEP